MFPVYIHHHLLLIESSHYLYIWQFVGNPNVHELSVVPKTTYHTVLIKQLSLASIY